MSALKSNAIVIGPEIEFKGHLQAFKFKCNNNKQNYLIK